MAGKMKVMSFEEIDRHISRVNLGGIKPPPKTAVAAALPNLGNVCRVYCAIRPILVALGQFPLIPAKWRQAVNLFIQVMDPFCPCNE